ncbi:HdeD family acid-resistance protein [Pedobacter frigiditerrae]|uniref:HdeD family acid-resistance protein n=1 Tax=Pedobacter frigiditerrae TaxID=2530452 RepID=UPI002930460C|nr:DUF308 domain-containing protein [Pedobacter frigiditerrae]
MKKHSFNVIGYDTKYWWLLYASGVLFVFLGSWIIVSPQKSYLFLSLLLAIGLLTTGLFESLYSIFHIRKIKDWGWIFIGGLIDAILGVYLLNYPLIAIILMPFVIGIWMLFRAFMTVSSSIALKTIGVKGWLWLLVTSMVLILPSILILINPFAELINIVFITGIAFVLSGIFRIIFSQRLKSLMPK